VRAVVLPGALDGRRRRRADCSISRMLPIESARLRRSVRLGSGDLPPQAMRILALENELTSKRGGQEISLLDVCRGLAARGHRVTLAYVTPGDLEDEYRAFCSQMIRVRTYSVDRSRLIGSIGEFVDTLRSIRGERPDVVYANQYLDSLFAGVACRVYRAPFVCHLRLPPPDVMCTQFRIGMSQVDRLIAISEQTK